MHWKMIVAGHYKAGPAWEIRRELDGRPATGVDIGWERDRVERVRWRVYENGRPRPREYRSLGVAKDAVRQIGLA